MQAIKVGEASERSQVSKERTPSVWMRLHHDGMARVEVPGRWIIIERIKHAPPLKLGIMRLSMSKSITREIRHNTAMSSYDCSFVNLKDIFMKFGEVVQNRVKRQGQNDFSPGGTHRGNFTLLSNFGQFENQGKRETS